MGGGRKGGGKGSFKGGFGCGDRGPILEEPPLYPPEKMMALQPADACVCRGDCRLIGTHRNLLAHWKTSACFVDEAVGDAATTGGVGYAGAQRLLRQTEPDRDPEAQMREITRTGGVTTAFFPAELLLRNQLKIRGRTTARSVLEALRKIEGKESKRQDKGGSGEKPKDGEVEQKTGDVDMIEDDDNDDEDFGDDDYVVDHGDFEDGMGNDFDEPGDGGGDADY